MAPRRSDNYSDIDGRPGSFENSPEYDRIYNPQGENEFTNLPENPNQIEYLQLLRRQHEYAKTAKTSEAQATLSRVQFWPDVGRFIVPKENTFAAHQRLVREGKNLDIQFDPETYKYFDAVLINHARRKDLFDPTHQKYAHYSQLRENLAVLRNDIMGMYMEDGAFDPGDEKYLPLLIRIAADLGDALYADKHPMGFLAPRLDANIMNIEGEGAAYAYEYIEKTQSKDTFFGKLWAKFREMVGQPPRRYHLPPIELSAFSREKLDLPPPDDELCQCSPEELTSRCYALLREKAQAGNLPKEHVDMLSLMEKREAINHGHIILEWLRNIKFSEKPLSEWIGTGEPIERMAERKAIEDIIGSWYEIVEGIEAGSPQLMNQPRIREAAAIVETLEHSLSLLAKLEKPVSIADTMQISSEASRQPERWNELAGQTVERLMQTLKGGIEDAVGTLQQQEMDMEEQQEEQVERNLEAALQHQARGKRKRRKQGASASGAKQKKLDRDIRADDRTLGQGVYANRPNDASAPTTATAAGSVPQGYKQAQLKAKIDELAARDPDLIKHLGKIMLGQEAAARQAQAAVSDVPANTPLLPEEQPFAQQLIAQKERSERDTSKSSSKRPQL